MNETRVDAVLQDQTPGPAPEARPAGRQHEAISLAAMAAHETAGRERVAEAAVAGHRPDESSRATRRLPPRRAWRIGLLALLAPVALAAATAEVPLLVDGSLAGWEARTFNGETRYGSIVEDGHGAVRADAEASGSGLFRTIRIDLKQTPVLAWRWRVAGTLGDIDETQRSGDDYAARVYVVASHPLFFWRTRAISYVWASRQPTGGEWPNAYTAQAKMVALRSGDAEAGRWVMERRDVRADFVRLFGEDVGSIDAVAIMTDTDDTGTRATAWYADLRFVAAE